MSNIVTTGNNTFSVLVNDQTVAGYTSPESEYTFNVNSVTFTVPDSTFKKEANFEIDTNVPTTIVNGALSISIDKAVLSPATANLGFRLSNAAGNDNFKFSTTDTLFSTSELPIAAKESDNNYVDTSIIWSTGLIGTFTSDPVIIPVSIKYESLTTPAVEGPVTFDVEVFTKNAAVISLFGSTSQTTPGVDETAQDLSISAVSASLANTLTGHLPADLSTNLTDPVNVNTKVVLKNELVTTTATNYKPITALTFTQEITTRITPTMLYATANASYTTLAALEAATTDVAAVDISVQTTGTITADMASTAGNDYSLLFTDGNLASTIYVYIVGTINS